MFSTKAFHRASKLAAGPTGVAAATGAASIFLGRKTATRTSVQLNKTATRCLNEYAKPRLMNMKLWNVSQTIGRRNFSSTSATASNSTKSATLKEGGFLQWYENHLQNRPITTKAITGSILWGLGDVVAQVVPEMMHDGEVNNDDATKEGSKQQSQSKVVEYQYDYPRTARAMIFGFALHAPLSHAHFNFLEWMTVKGGFSGLSAPVFKAFMEQFVYWSWISNSLYHGAMGAMQGKTFQQVYDRIADVIWETQKAQWVFWIPVQLLNFRFVPVRHQLNVVLVTSVVWTALLSAWYPPEEEKDESKEENDTKSD